jgi:hypothetical protein
LSAGAPKAASATRPEGLAELFTEGGTHRHPSGQVPGAMLTGDVPAYPFAPTEFPKERSAIREVGRRAPFQRMTYTLQVEDTIH